MMPLVNFLFSSFVCCVVVTLIVFVKGAKCNNSAERFAERHHQRLAQHQINPGRSEGYVRED